jgi:hypothetical protein
MLKVKQDSDCVHLFWEQAKQPFKLTVRDVQGVLEVQTETGLKTQIVLNDLKAVWLDMKREDVGYYLWPRLFLSPLFLLFPGLMRYIPGLTYRTFLSDLVLHTKSGQFRLPIRSTEAKHGEQRLVLQLASYAGCEVAPFSKQSAMNAEFNFQYTSLC